MWMYAGTSCPDRSFSIELDEVEIKARILRFLALRAHRNSGPSSIPLREGVISPWVSLLELILA
jgi:hypothetical protein